MLKFAIRLKPSGMFLQSYHSLPEEGELRTVVFSRPLTWNDRGVAQDNLDLWFPVGSHLRSYVEIVEVRCGNPMEDGSWFEQHNEGGE